MHILTFTTLYPNMVQPTHGVFVENRLRHLLKETNIKAKVIAPIPYLPRFLSGSGHYPDYQAVPYFEERHGIEIYHPRYLVFPKVGWYLTPWLMYQGVKKLARRLHQENNFNLIDAHYLFPDGVTASYLAGKLELPLIMTARGTDVNLIPNYKWPRRMIQKACAKARHIITVCEALRNDLIALNVDHLKITALRNGVDLENFNCSNRKKAQSDMGFEQHKINLLSVGHLIDRKGHDRIIKAMSLLDRKYQLYIAGSGADLGYLQNLTKDLGLQDQVTFLGTIDHESLPALYRAADLTILASSREGWPNVVLESMACGTPVLSNTVNGTPEIIKSYEAGVLMPDREPETIAKFIRNYSVDLPNPQKTADYAKNFSWEETSLGQKKIFEGIL